jgi:hypothetical protein
VEIRWLTAPPDSRSTRGLARRCSTVRARAYPRLGVPSLLQNNIARWSRKPAHPRNGAARPPPRFGGTTVQIAGSLDPTGTGVWMRSPRRALWVRGNFSIAVTSHIRNWK